MRMACLIIAARHMPVHRSEYSWASKLTSILMGVTNSTCKESFFILGLFLILLVGCVLVPALPLSASVLNNYYVHISTVFLDGVR